MCRVVRGKFLLPLFIFIGLLAANPIYAGGCCLVLSVDNLPEIIVAGEPVTLTYTARVTFDDGTFVAQPETITAVHGDTGEQLLVTAESTSKRNQFEAVLTFPTAGDWQWQLGSRSMPPLMVRAANATSDDPLPSRPYAGMGFGTSLIGLLAVVIGLGAWFRHRSPYRLAFIIGAGIVALGGFVFQLAGPGLATAGTERAVFAIAPEEMGEALFVAKGCTTCHAHEALVITQTAVSAIGPDLTYYRGDPDFLRRWLAEPRRIRPNTLMPNLELSEQEIETLVDFLSPAPAP